MQPLASPASPKTPDPLAPSLLSCSLLGMEMDWLCPSGAAASTDGEGEGEELVNQLKPEALDAAWLDLSICRNCEVNQPVPVNWDAFDGLAIDVLLDAEPISGTLGLSATSSLMTTMMEGHTL